MVVAPSNMLLAGSAGQPRGSLIRPRSEFKLCGGVGLGIAIILTMTLAAQSRLSPWVMAGIAAAGLATLSGMAMTAKLITGKEQFVCYRTVIAVLAVVATILWLAHEPIPSYLDLTILGVGMFVACGRVGCLMVGCCHGRICRWGIRYGKEHAKEGFPSHLVGVRLFPVQALESIFVFCLVAFPTAFVLKGFPAGSALAFYVVTYAFGRFWIEFARGDSERPYFGGFSEAQWTSLFLAIGVVCAEYGKIIPANTWHRWIPLCLATSMIVVSLARRLQKTSRFNLLHPRHVRELAEAIKVAVGASRYPMTRNSLLGLKPEAAVTHLAYTSLGIRISAGDIIQPNHCLRHYTLSKETDSLTAGSARLLAELIAHLNQASCRFELLECDSGVFHLIFETDSAAFHKESLS